MNIQQQTSSQTFQSLINDQSKRIMVIRTLIKTLSSLGYQKTVSILEKQSLITNQTIQIEKLKQFLSSYDYQSSINYINMLQHLPQHIKRNSIESLNELKIMKLIQKRQYDDAVMLIGNDIKRQQTQLQLYQMMALDQQISHKVIQSKHQYIIKNCITDTTEESSVESLLQNIIYYQDNHVIDHLVKNPPKYYRAKSHSFTNIVGKVSFVKLNKHCNQIALISQSRKEYQLSIWKILKNKIKRTQYFKSAGIGCINCLKWISFKEQQNIMVLSYDKIRMYSRKKLQFLFEIERKVLKKERFLCAQIHPISNIVYAGGLFEGLIGFNNKGEIVNEIYTYTKIRQLVFQQSGLLYFISATKGQIIKFDMQCQRKIDIFNANSCFMDLKYIQQKVITTNKNHILIFNKTKLIPISIFDSPINDRIYKIESFMVNNWLITFNEKLSGILKTEQSVTHYKWQDVIAMDIKNDYMVTFRGNLRLYHTQQAEQSNSQDNDNESSKYENLMMDENDESQDQIQQVDEQSLQDVWIQIQQYDQQEQGDQQSQYSLQQQS